MTRRRTDEKPDNARRETRSKHKKFYLLLLLRILFSLSYSFAS